MMVSLKREEHTVKLSYATGGNGDFAGAWVNHSGMNDTSEIQKEKKYRKCLEIVITTDGIRHADTNKFVSSLLYFTLNMNGIRKSAKSTRKLQFW